MPNIDIYKLITQIIDDNQSKRFTTPRSMIKYLVPIEKAYGYYTGNKAEFYDPQENQIFYRNFSSDNEKSRLESISYINGRIDYYNRHTEEKVKKNKTYNHWALENHINFLVNHECNLILYHFS